MIRSMTGFGDASTTVEGSTYAVEVRSVNNKYLKTNIRSITISTEDGVFEGHLVLFVSDLEHLRRLIDRIKRIPGIHGVYRFEEQSEDSGGR